MKIVMLNTHDTVGGAAIACRRLIESLLHVDQNLEISLLVREKKSKLNYVHEVGSKINLYLEKLLFLSKEKSKSTRFSFSTNAFGSNIYKNQIIQNADIIHIHWVNQGFLSLKQIGEVLVLNKPVFWTFHDMWPITGGCHQSRDCELYTSRCGNCNQFLQKPKDQDISNQTLESKLNWASRDQINIISISKWMKEKVVKSTLFKTNPIYSIPNPIDNSIFYPKNTGKKNKRINILIVAATIDNSLKGFDLLVKISEELKVRQPNKFELTLVGKVTDESLEKLSLPHTSLGPISDDQQMAAIYNDADLLLSTSPDESFSYTCLEALSCGISIIAYDTGAIASFVKAFQNGILVKEYKLKSYIKAFEQYLLQEPKEHIELDRNPFSYQSVGTEMLKLYSEKV